MPDRPMRRTISAFRRRDLLTGRPSMFSSFPRYSAAAANASARPPYILSEKKPEKIFPCRAARRKNPCVRRDGWSIRLMPGVLDGLLMVGCCAGHDSPIPNNRQYRSSQCSAMASVSSRPERKLDGSATPRAIALVKYLPPIPRRATPPVPKPFAWLFPACRADSRICGECGGRGRGFARGRFPEVSSQSSRSGERVRQALAQSFLELDRPILLPRCRSLPAHHKKQLRPLTDQVFRLASGLHAFACRDQSTRR